MGSVKADGRTVLVVPISSVKSCSNIIVSSQVHKRCSLQTCSNINLSISERLVAHDNDQKGSHVYNCDELRFLAHL